MSFVQSFKFHDHGNAAVSGTRIRNALTFDFEDWYHGLEIPLSQCDGFGRRIRYSGERLLELLAGAGVRGTFFVLGRVAEQHPGLVKAIAAAGHEIGTHGSGHEFVYRLTEPQFREKMTRCVAGLENLTGIKVLGHRAPFFSITRNSLWALDVLADLGLVYDSSIFPVVNYRYGVPEAPRWPYEEVINIGNDSEISIRQLAELVRERTNSRSEIQLVPYERAYGAGFEDMHRRVPSLEKLQRLIGYRPSTPLPAIIDAVAQDVQMKLSEETALVAATF